MNDNERLSRAFYVLKAAIVELREAAKEERAAIREVLSPKTADTIRRLTAENEVLRSEVAQKDAALTEIRRKFAQLKNFLE